MKNDKVNPFGILAGILSSAIRKMWPMLTLLLSATIVSMAVELAPSLLLKRIVDDYLKNSIVEGIWTIALLYLCASVVTSLFGFGRNFLTTYLGQNMLLELRIKMAEHLSSLPLQYFNRTPVGDIMSRLTSDVDAVNTLLSSGLISAVTDLVKLVGILGAMYLISPRLSMVALLFIPAIFVLSNYFRKNIYKSQIEIRKRVGNINTFIQELFNGMKTVKAYGMEERYRDSFQMPLNKHLDAVNKTGRYDSYFPCIMQVLRALAIAVILWFGAKTGLPAAVGVTVGGLAALADLLGKLFSPIESLAQEFQTIQQAMAGLARIAEFISEKPEERGEIQRVNDSLIFAKADIKIDVHNVRFGYSPDKAILKDVSLNVLPGKKVAIVGRTGAGKTTLMNLIAGLYTPLEGSISVGGYDPHRLNPSDRRRLLGVVPQNVYIFEGTISENITLRDSSIPQYAVEEAAKTVGLHDFFMTLPEGYETMLGEANMKLSFGQSQLLSLARAIAANPPLLLLDEPTSGMDAVTEAMVFDALRKVSEHRTIITISHRLSGILDADEVHIMAAGRVVQSGSPEKLAGENGWYSVFGQLEAMGWRS